MADSGVKSKISSNKKEEVASGEKPAKKHPICVLVIGMAGSGKTNVVNQLKNHFTTNKKSFSIVNLDPAVRSIPYSEKCLIDIRDSVDFKEVMKKYELGPNGGIVTSLNLFSAAFDDVLQIMEEKAAENEFVIFDTPGQIEVFNWSASGPIIAGTLASEYPTIIVYVVDTHRSRKTNTFMANMLYACSVLFKYKLPFVLAFNKIDILDWNFAKDWMTNFESFQEELSRDESYSANLTRSLSLAIEEFYNNITACGVSAHTGKGFDELEQKIREAAVEFEDYREELAKIKKTKEENAAKKGGEETSGISKIRFEIKNNTEMLLGPHSDDSSDEEHLDEADTEEVKEGDGFLSFLQQQKNLSQSRNQQ